MRYALIRTLLAVSVFVPGLVMALDIQLPVETGEFKPSELPGYTLAKQNCLICHSVHYIQSQPPMLPRSYWEATVKKMRAPFGAKFTDEDIPVLVEYLVKTYGAERGGTTASNTADKPAAVGVTAVPDSSNAK